METIKEQNGWKLGKKDGVFYLICPSGEEVRLSITHESNLNNCFNHAVTNNWTWLKRTFYTVSVIKGEIKTNKEEKSIRSDKVELFDKTHYISSEQAKQAINDVLPRAEKHFRDCLKKYLEICKEMQFSVGFNYDGDTHGIYNEYEYISFKLDGFNFQFPIGE